jgi:phosphatidylinositol glycan class Q protein
VLRILQPHSVDGALRAGILYRNSPHAMERMFELCGQSQMHVLGVANGTTSPGKLDPFQIHASLEPSSPIPRICCPREHGICIQIIVYKQPSPAKMQYMSLSPISLALADKSRKTLEPQADLSPDARLLKKLEMHTVRKHQPTRQELLLPTIVYQINCSTELSQLLTQNMNLIGVRQKRKLSVSERVVESATTLWDYVLLFLWHLITAYAYPLITRAFKLGLICHRMVAEITLRVLEWRPRVKRYIFPALKDISATAQQVDIRLQQFCYWPIQYVKLRKRKEDWDSVTDSHPDYIRFYNSLWLVANDVIIGIALGSYIIENADWAASTLSSTLSQLTITGLKATIAWLMDWPAGLKLNTELAEFLGALFLWVIEFWECKTTSVCDG